MRIENKATVTVFVSDGQERKSLSPGESCDIERPIIGKIRITADIGNVEMTFAREGSSRVHMGNLKYDPMEEDIILMEN